MISLTQQDYNILKQKYIRKYIKIDLLDFKYNIVDELSGNCISFSNTIDANSDLRRGCSVEMVITDSSFEIKAGSKIFLDRYIRTYVGYEDNLTGDIIWYNKGIYLINNPSWRYNGATNTMSFDALDLMSKMTGLRNGYLEGIPTIISQGENVRKAIIDTIALAGFDKYIVEECQTKNDYGEMVEQKVPYDIEIDQGKTVYDILTALRDIMPNYEIFFDEDGVFHYQMIPTGDDEPNMLDDDLLAELVMDEVINTDFESVKNYVEVYGHTWDLKYYSSASTTQVDGSVITPTFADTMLLTEYTTIGLSLPQSIGKSYGLPEGYTQLDSISATGTQYIDTGVKPNQDTRIVMTVSGYSLSNLDQGAFGARTSQTANDKFSLSVSSDAKAYRSGYGSQNTDFEQSVNISGVLKIDKKGRTTILNELYIATSDKAEFECPYNLYLFAINTANTASAFGKFTMSNCKIYDADGNLIRDYIPCKDTSNAVGLYDLVNGQFYGNAGTDSFTAGAESQYDIPIKIKYPTEMPVVNGDNMPVTQLDAETIYVFQYTTRPYSGELPVGYTKVEYIQSSGTQYIDTGFKPNQDTRATTDFQMTDSTTEQTPFLAREKATVKSFGIFYASSGWMADYGGGRKVVSTSIKVTDRILADFNKNAITMNGTSVSFDAATFTTPVNLVLFARNTNGMLSNYASMKLYACQIYDNGTIVRHFIPCKNPDGAIGLYDTIGKQFYANAGTGDFTAGPDVADDSGTTNEPTWLFMGHQQSQATIYDNDPRSPFYVGDPIGSSSVGRIRIVLCGGDYSNIYSDYLAKERAKFELYQRCRLQDSITLTMVPIPWLDVHTMISYATKGGDMPVQYLVKSINADYGSANGTMTVNAIKYYPYYPDDEKGG